jgi:hypothetical protein
VIVGVGSWRGVGATTTALAVSASLAGRGLQPWLIEADPAGGVLAARIAGVHGAGGLEEIAFPTERHDIVERFNNAAIDVGGSRLITAPGDPFRAWSCHAPRMPWVHALRDLDGPVIVDLGRLRGGSPIGAVLAQVDLLLIVSDADVVSVVSTIEWATALGRIAPTDAALPIDLTRVVVVDAPTTLERIGRTDAQAELGDRFAGWLPWSPESIRLLHAGARVDDRRLRRHGLTDAASHLSEQMLRWTGHEVAA